MHRRTRPRLNAAKLSELDVLEIRLNKDQLTSLEWAELLGVTYGAIVHVLSHHTWKHVQHRRVRRIVTPRTRLELKRLAQLQS